MIGLRPYEEMQQTKPGSLAGGRAADGRYRQRGQRDAGIQAFRLQLEVGHAASGVDYIGHILPGSDEDRSEPVRVMRVVTDRIRVQVADNRRMPHIE